MKPARPSRSPGFTLLETVIAIGVLSVLLTAFIVVFTPAADGIRKSLSLQQADRMASALEQELVTLRGSTETTNYKTGFNKSFDWIKKSNTAADSFFVYQYRGAVSNPRTTDGTPTPVVSLSGKLPGVDYVVVPMCRRKSDALFAEDLAAVEGGVYLVKCRQLVYVESDPPTVPKTYVLGLGKFGEIKNPKPKPDPDTVPPYEGGPFTSADLYPEAVIAFSAEFYSMPVKTAAYFSSTTFTGKYDTFKSPVFTRNLAVRR